MIASILVGTDGSDAAGVAVAHATAIAAAMGARLLIVSAYAAVPDGPGAPRVDRDEVALWAMNPSREEVLALLADAANDARAAGAADVDTFARVGDAADAILDVAEEQHADMIVVGNKGLTGAPRFLLGSVPNKVSHHAPCSVLIVRAPA